MKKMHRFILTFAMALCSMAVLAQSGFNYQAVIRNNGEVISNQDVTLRISIMNGNEVCYQETQKTKNQRLRQHNCQCWQRNGYHWNFQRCALGDNVADIENRS